MKKHPQMNPKSRIGNIAVLVLATGAVALSACRRVPDGVIQPEDMSALLADMHVADAVVEQNRRCYSSDSVKMVLKQSVLARHGVDLKQFDSALSWYAHNPELYLEVYDGTINILQNRMKSNDALLAQGSLSVVGDSVDLWAGARYLSVSELSVNRTVVFDIEADDNSQQGDRYIWRGKFINNKPKAHWAMAATYSNGTVEVLDADVVDEGWNEIEFVSDSTLSPERIYGYLRFDPRSGSSVWVDSLQLVRSRKTDDAYRKRYRLKSYRR